MDGEDIMAKKIGKPKDILSYQHDDRRVNNPEVGMVTPSTDPDSGAHRWVFDPHLSPDLDFDSTRGAIEQLIDSALSSGTPEIMEQALQELKRLQAPYLNWTGKQERTSFEVDNVSLHVHERIDSASILNSIQRSLADRIKANSDENQPSLFDLPFESAPLREAIDFYKHDRGWANRLIAGDSLLVMNSLLNKESMAGQVQMFYIDPPYGIRYGSNFQPFIGKRDVKDRNDADLTQEPEMIKAFRDTWELGTHSYLTYLRDRILLARDLLAETGSVFVQISDENVHLVRQLLDESFGSENFVAQINYRSRGTLGQQGMANVYDYVVWYAKDKSKMKFRPIFKQQLIEGGAEFRFLDNGGGSFQKLSGDEVESLDFESSKRIFKRSDLRSSGYTPSCVFDFNLWNKPVTSGGRKSWRTNTAGIERLKLANRLFFLGDAIYFKQFHGDFPLSVIENSWTDTAAGFADQKTYVVQTHDKIISRCMLMTTDPGDLVLDPTCGSGTTAHVAEKWGRRWITCDTSRVAITLAKQRLLTASFDYFDLKYPNEGVKGGFIYKTVPHVTLGAIANNPDIDELYEELHPAIEKALEALNSELVSNPPSSPFEIRDGARAVSKISFQGGNTLEEWEVPAELNSVENSTWSSEAKVLLQEFHSARKSLQEKIDRSVYAHADQEVLYDQPQLSKTKLRVTGPFTVEAVPFPTVTSLDEPLGSSTADNSIARVGESGRQHEWLAELMSTGIRGKNGQMLEFADLETFPADQALRNIHAVGNLISGERVVVSFGPAYAALEQRQVSNVLTEAGSLFPQPKMVVFCAFTFDPEAAKDIDSIKGINALKIQMNTDLLTEDLKKSRSSNESFWLMGQPDVEVRQRIDGKFEVEIHGFDYFDTVKGELVSGGKSKIAMWALDTDYDDRSLFPRQVFFPMASKGEGWDRLKKDLRAELDESLLTQFHGTTSLPFTKGQFGKIAVKIVDDRGIESLKVMSLES
jgi:adenine-specific DNA-methyltransferase